MVLLNNSLPTGLWFSDIYYLNAMSFGEQLLMKQRISVLEYVGLPGSGKTTIVLNEHSGDTKVQVSVATESQVIILRVIYKIIFFIQAVSVNFNSSLKLFRAGVRDGVKLNYICNAILLQHKIQSADELNVMDQSLVQLIICNRVVKNGLASPQFEKELLQTIKGIKYTVRMLHIDFDTFMDRSIHRDTLTKTNIKACPENYQLFSSQLSLIIDEMTGVVEFENF